MKTWKKVLTAVMTLTVIFAAFGMMTYAAAEYPTEPPVTVCKHKNTAVTVIDATCGVAGSKTTKCIDCGIIIKTEVIPATGKHESYRVREIKKETCVKDGFVRHLCKNCAQDYIVVRPANPNNHAKTWRNVEYATCEKDGKTEEYCKDCGKVFQTKTVPAMGHKEAWRTQKRATCTQEGVEIKYCPVCQKSDGTTRPIPKTAHTWDEGAWKTTKEPTCTKEGKTEQTFTCTKCGAKETRATRDIEALGHNYGEWKVTKEPTETKAGEKARVCTRCGDKQTARIPSKGNHKHNFNGKTEVVKEATCTKSGLKRVYCSVGGCNEYDEIIINAGHKYGGWVITREATPEKNGARTRTCSICGKVLTETFAYYVAPSEEVTDEITDVTDEIADISEMPGTTAVGNEPVEEDGFSGMIIGIVIAALAVIAGGAGIVFAVKKKKQ